MELPRRHSGLTRPDQSDPHALVSKGGEPPAEIPAATHTGTLTIGNAELACFVLDDGTRVLSQSQFLEALGRHPKANVRNEGAEEQLPAILQGKSIKPFITKDLIEK